MKCKVIKEYAGIKIGTEVFISGDRLDYMIRKGYVEPIKPKKAKVQNKMIDPKYKKNVTFKDKGND